ncbi:hypothetical protein A2526_04165 [candidate division WOR-1 bacterium RIFOXYD2_FULL_36_8]|nr:MAG: hypothetical protein A2526_04165 [candidate division WOR-1 bacterium RIFOXYD2_FULL_36_8]
MIAYFFILPKKIISIDKIDKITSLKNAYMSGYNEGKKSWEFYATEGWSDKYQQITYLKDVSKGNLYEDGELITSNLSASTVKVFKRSKIVEAAGLEKKQLSANIAFTSKKNKEKRKFAGIKSNFLKYIPNDKRTELAGNINIKEKNIKISGEKMAIDHNEETAKIENNVKVIRSDISINCNILAYDSKQEKLNLFENITAKIKGKQKTKVKADNISFFLDDEKDININGNIELTQEKKNIVGNKAFYNKKENNIFFQDGTKAVIEKGGALLKEETTKKLKSPDAKNLLKEKTIIEANALNLSTKNGDVRAEGNVFVSQKGKEAKSDYADYSDLLEIITLTKNVYLKKDTDWIKCEKITVFVKDEIFEATGSIEAEFKLKIKD